MARNTKPGKESDVTKALVKEEQETQKRNAERHQENVNSEKEKEAARLEAQDTTKTVAEPKVDESGRKKRYEALLERYQKASPVKYAAKKAAGEFKDIPVNFR